MKTVDEKVGENFSLLLRRKDPSEMLKNKELKVWCSLVHLNPWPLMLSASADSS